MDNDPRRLWGDAREPDRPALFQPGDELRCPAGRRLSGGAIRTCGFTLHMWAKVPTIVRPRITGSVGVIGGVEFHCHACHNVSDMYPVRNDIRLGATG